MSRLTTLYFVTGNANKFAEFKAALPHIEQLGLELDEVQSLDPQTVIEHKLAQAADQHAGEFIVEDTSLCIDSLGGLPGTFIKWFIKALSLEGIGNLAACYPDQSATARTTIGYRDAQGENHYFVGEIRGRVVPPRGAGGFGWDDIFVPEGHSKTFSELGPDKKRVISMRRRAIDQLQAHLEAHR